MFQEKQIIHNCYDSHVHWLATGEAAFRLDLSQLPSAEAVKDLQVRPPHYRGDWLIGFGWDQHKWEGGKTPHREILDRAFPNTPVAFSRADGHAIWLSTEAIKRAGLFYKFPEAPAGGKILLDANGIPSGVVFENAAENIRKIIPPLMDKQIQDRLLYGAQQFNAAGFTHIRDLSGNLEQWSACRSLERAGKLNLVVNQLFAVEAGKSFHQALRSALQAKKDESRQMRCLGVKVYLDGSLGSETAYLSQKYRSGSGRGMCLLERFTLKEMMIETWSAGLDLAVHAIGDEAFHMLAGVAHELWERGEQGNLHIEHAQVARPESILLLDPQQTEIHMQPCHWLSDRAWLKNKLGDLYQYSFPWKLFEEKNLPVYFGSDSPIERSSLQDNYYAVRDAAQNSIPMMKKDFLSHHSLPEKSTRTQGRTVFKDGQVESLYLGEKQIFLSH